MGPLGGRYFFDPVGEVSFVIEKLEDDLIGFLPGFVSLVGDDREVVAAKAMGLQQLINKVRAAETQSRSKQPSGLSEEMARHSYQRPYNEYTARTNYL